MYLRACVLYWCFLGSSFSLLHHVVEEHTLMLETRWIMVVCDVVHVHGLGWDGNVSRTSFSKRTCICPLPYGRFISLLSLDSYPNSVDWAFLSLDIHLCGASCVHFGTRIIRLYFLDPLLRDFPQCPSPYLRSIIILVFSRFLST